MLNDLEKHYSVIHIAGREYRGRYSLNALLCLEQCYKPINKILEISVDSWDIECVLQLIRAFLCDNEENRKAVIRRDWNNVKPSLFELGQMIDIKDFRLLKLEIIDAITNSFPAPVIGARKSTEEFDYQAIRSIYCDIMNRSEKDFWTSNLKEILQRTEKYFEVKGLKEPVEKIQMFED